MSKVLLWIVWNIPLGRLAPIVLGWALKTKGERMIGDKEEIREIHRCSRSAASKIFRKMLFPLKCIVTVLFAPLMLFVVGALLVMRYEDDLLD